MVGPPKDVFTAQIPSGVGPALDVFAEPVPNSGGGGAGSVVSVDVSGGTTGLTTTGGPVTTTGVITIHLPNNVQFSGRNSTDSGDIGLVGVDTSNRMTMMSYGLMDPVEENLKITSTDGNHDRGFNSYSGTDTRNGAMFVGDRSGGTPSAMTIPPSTNLPQPITNFSGRVYDGVNWLRTGIIQLQYNTAPAVGNIPSRFAFYLGDGSVDAINTTPKGFVDSTGQWNLSGLNYPIADGTPGQVIKTDGAGTLSFGSGSGASLTATRIGYGDASNDLTGDAEHTWDTTNKVRSLNELIDSTSFTETKIQPFHKWQITNKVREPGTIGATRHDTSGYTNISWIKVPNSTSTTGYGTTFTFSCWYYLSLAPDGSHWPAAIAKNGEYTLRIINQAGTFKWSFEIATLGAAAWQGSQAAIGATTGAWNHIMVTWDGAVPALYLNGATMTITSNTLAAGSIPSNTNAVTIIGSTGSDSGPAGTGGMLDGKFDEVRLYKRVLTLSDAQAQYNSGAGLYIGTETGLVAAWHLDEPSGSTVADLTGNGNTGTLSGAAPPTFTTGLIVGSPTLVTKNIITHKDGVNDGEAGIMLIGDTGTILQFGTDTVGTATSGAGTLPGNPLGFLKAQLPDGTAIRLPYYNA